MSGFSSSRTELSSPSSSRFGSSSPRSQTKLTSNSNLSIDDVGLFSPPPPNVDDERAKLGPLDVSKDAKMDRGDAKISLPMAVKRLEHVRYDAENKSFVGLPADWQKALNKQFGVPLSQLREVVQLDEYRSPIPEVLVTMKTYLLKHCLKLEGVFRLAADSEEMAYVKNKLNTRNFDKCDDPHCIPNLIKVWFRELPTPVMSCVDPELIKSCYTDSDAGAIVDKMPDPWQSLLLWLLDLCVVVANNQQFNRMSETALAIVVGPNLFSPTGPGPAAGGPGAAAMVGKDGKDGIETLKFSAKMAEFLTKALVWRKKNPDAFFPIPPPPEEPAD